MKVHTIGFTRTTAESFFTRLKKAGVKRVVDVRLSNLSQLAGFARKQDLPYFLEAICGIDYVHRLELAPTPAMLEAYRKKELPWPDYEKQFLKLMESRGVEETVERKEIDGACLLCSEDSAKQCHRRLVAEYLAQKWGDLEIVHL